METIRLYKIDIISRGPRCIWADYQKTKSVGGNLPLEFTYWWKVNESNYGKFDGYLYSSWKRDYFLTEKEAWEGFIDKETKRNTKTIGELKRSDKLVRQAQRKLKGLDK